MYLPTNDGKEDHDDLLLSKYFSLDSRLITFLFAATKLVQEATTPIKNIKNNFIFILNFNLTKFYYFIKKN